MKHQQSDSKSASRLRGGERVMYLLRVEAQTLADHLDELPTVIAEMNALVDEVSRRRAKVAVREALVTFQTLHRRLHAAIAKLAELLDLREANGPMASGTHETGCAMLGN